MIRDRIEFWRLMGEYARVMDVYLSLPRIEGIDYDRLIDETEAEVWAMIDRHREGLDNSMRCDMMTGNCGCGGL